MFPVPLHLPRTGPEHIASPVGPSTPPPDATLDLLLPLIGASTSYTVRDVTRVRQRLEEALKDNKARSHDLLKGNFPAVSSHIRLGDSVRSDFGKLQTSIRGLEKDLDASDPETSFLPPVLAQLDRHFTAGQTRARAEARINALRSLSEQVERTEKLERAVYAGRGADGWVVDALLEDRGESTVLSGTRVSRAARAKMEMFRSMVIEQVTDGFSKAVSLSTSTDEKHGTCVSVPSKASLQQPRIPLPVDFVEATKPSILPPYSLSHICATLSRFSALSSALHKLRIRLVNEVIQPVLDSSWRVTTSTADMLSLLRLDSVDGDQPPKGVLDGISTILRFIDTAVFPLDPATRATERASFLTDLHTATFEAILNRLILASMPSPLASLPSWLSLVTSAYELESTLAPDCSVVRPFFEYEVGKAWADQRRRKVCEEVRRLITGGWGGWESIETKRERELTVLVEVEVSEDEYDVEAELPSETRVAGPVNGFEWGFDDVKQEVGGGGSNMRQPSIAADDDGWGIESPGAGPSRPREDPKTSNGTGETNIDEGDGWDFDADVSAVAAPESPQPVIKPSKEAKRLGKKVAKVKAVMEDDPWGSGSEYISGARPLGNSTPSSDMRSGVDDWGWGNEDVPADNGPDRSNGDGIEAGQSRARKRKRVLKEEKRAIKESFLVSRACEKLIDAAERVLLDASDLLSRSFPSPSFATAEQVLLATATDVFDVHRSLLPTHYATQLRDVPTLAMQLSNDAYHLSTLVKGLQASHPAWDASDVSTRLVAMGDWAFESQLIAQRDAIMETLDEASGFVEVGNDVGLRKCERSVKGVIHSVDTLSRVLKVVLPRTTYLSAMGYLTDQAIERISSDVLGLQDITEVESERLGDLLKLVHPLEEIFLPEPEQSSAIVAQVPHWLKFCYVSELLKGNLVDILYLFDSGALVDFTTQELVGIIRALFADSEKRDGAIQRIEGGRAEVA